MIRVNLLAKGAGPAQPRVWVPAEQKNSLIGLGMLLVTGLVVGGWWYYLNAQRNATEESIIKAETKIEQLKDALKVLETARQQKAELEQRLALIDQLRIAKHVPVRLLHLLNATVPSGLWLLEIKQAGTSVQIEGRAMSTSSVTDYAQSLQEAGFFKMPVEIVTTLMETVEDSNVYRFVLKAEPMAAPVVPSTGSAITAPQPPAGGLEV